MAKHCGILNSLLHVLQLPGNSDGIWRNRPSSAHFKGCRAWVGFQLRCLLPPDRQTHTQIRSVPGRPRLPVSHLSLFYHVVEGSRSAGSSPVGATGLVLAPTLYSLYLLSHFALSLSPPQRDLDFTFELDFKGQLCEAAIAHDYKMR